MFRIGDIVECVSSGNYFHSPEVGKTYQVIDWHGGSLHLFCIQCAIEYPCSIEEGFKAEFWVDTFDSSDFRLVKKVTRNEI